MKIEHNLYLFCWYYANERQLIYVLSDSPQPSEYALELLQRPYSTLDVTAKIISLEIENTVLLSKYVNKFGRNPGKLIYGLGEDFDRGFYYYLTTNEVLHRVGMFDEDFLINKVGNLDTASPYRVNKRLKFLNPKQTETLFKFLTGKGNNGHRKFEYYRVYKNFDRSSEFILKAFAGVL